MSTVRIASAVVTAITVGLMVAVDVWVGWAFLVGFHAGLIATMAVGMETE